MRLHTRLVWLFTPLSMPILPRPQAFTYNIPVHYQHFTNLYATCHNMLFHGIVTCKYCHFCLLPWHSFAGTIWLPIITSMQSCMNRVLAMLTLARCIYSVQCMATIGCFLMIDKTILRHLITINFVNQGCSWNVCISLLLFLKIKCWLSK